MRRKILVSIGLITVLLAMGVGFAGFLVSRRSAPPTVDTQRPPLLVESVAVTPQVVTELIEGYGTAKADLYATISAQVAGVIVERAEQLRAGAGFAKDQILFRIDDRDYREHLTRATSQLAAEEVGLGQLDIEEATLDRKLTSAQTELTSAEWELKRVEELFESNVGIKKEYEDARRAVERMRRDVQTFQSQRDLIPARRAQLQALIENRRADVALARLNLERCKIATPFDGRIEQVMVEAGERVQVGAVLVSKLDPRLIEVPIDLPVGTRHRVSVGSHARLSVDTMSDVKWHGRIRRIAPNASESTRTFKAYVEVNNAEQDRQLVPGYFVRAIVDGPPLADAMVVPRGAIQGSRVFLFEDGRARPREIRVDRRLLDQAAVIGLDSGAIVITSNLDALYDGAPVRLATESIVKDADPNGLAQKPTSDVPPAPIPTVDER